MEAACSIAFHTVLFIMGASLLFYIDRRDQRNG